MSGKNERNEELENKLKAGEDRSKYLEVRLSKKEDELRENVALLQRTHADFQNYMKQVEKEGRGKGNALCNDLLVGLIDVEESLETAVKSVPKNDGNKRTVDGLNGLLKHIRKLLDERGVRKISSVGSLLDPKLHEAIEAVESEGKPEGMILEEIQSGYTINDTILRPAKVVVAKNKEVDETCLR